MLITAGCSKDKPSSGQPDDNDYDIFSIYPHNETYFTQGFEFSGDTLVESTGKNGYSKIVKYDLNTGNIFCERTLSSEYFGEGITVFNNLIYQLTWHGEKCFVYSYDDIEVLDTLDYTGEGWGLTNDGTDIIMSNGSDKLFFRDPATFGIIKTLTVKDSNNYSVSSLNELEFVNGIIYANVWGGNYIIGIDAESGVVIKKYYLTDLLSYEEAVESDVLNGIASMNGHFFVTGKYWPKIFEIELLK